MTSSALAAVTQMSMSNTSNMYNGVDHPHMSSHQGHHHQQQQQQQQLQQPHHATYMGAQGFFQDRNDLAEASIKGILKERRFWNYFVLIASVFHNSIHPI